MGVSGCGKSTVGAALARKFGGEYFDADDFHPAENVAKMARGEPLDDSDRTPWLARLRAEVIDPAPARGVTVLGCSALKRRYREALLGGVADAVIVYLKGDFENLEKRMEERVGHYMKAGMLRSQFDALESPEGEPGVVTLAVDQPIDAVVREAVRKLRTAHDEPEVHHGRPAS